MEQVLSIWVRYQRPLVNTWCNNTVRRVVGFMYDGFGSTNGPYLVYHFCIATHAHTITAVCTHLPFALVWSVE